MTDLGVRINPDRISLAINDRGQIIMGTGSWRSPRAFVWQDGKLTKLPTVDGRTLAPTAVNDRGQIVGGTSTRAFRAQAFLWENGKLTVLPSPVRLAFTPIVRIDPSGTSIVAESAENAGLRRRLLLWLREPLS